MANIRESLVWILTSVFRPKEGLHDDKFRQRKEKQ